MTWVMTWSGKRFDLINPRVEDVAVLDIIFSLSKQCRFNGNTREFYSVAEHSVLLSHRVSKRAALYGLFHDAAEAYTGDIVTPLKTPEIKKKEERIFAVIVRALGLGRMITPEIEAEVKEADIRMLATEKERLLMPGPQFPGLENVKPYPIAIDCWPHGEAAAEFADRMMDILREGWE